MFVLNYFFVRYKRVDNNFSGSSNFFKSCFSHFNFLDIFLIDFKVAFVKFAFANVDCRIFSINNQIYLKTILGFGANFNETRSFGINIFYNQSCFYYVNVFHAKCFESKTFNYEFNYKKA